MKTIYISGQMTGRTSLQIRESFGTAEKYLWRAGWRVVNPAHIPDSPIMRWEDYVLRDLLYLRKCDAIYMLSGWEKSQGARTEYEFARGMKLEIIFEKEQDYAQS